MSGRPHHPRQLLSTHVETRTVVGIVQTLQLLPLQHTEVTEMVDQALSENPLLERRAGAPCRSCGRHLRGRRCPTCAGHAVLGEDPRAAPVDELRSLALCEVPSPMRSVMVVVLEHLLPRGTLDMEPLALADLHGLPASDVAGCVRVLKQIGPPGIAETSVAELLAAQAITLVAIGAAKPWFTVLVRDHLDLIAARDVTSVARLVGDSEAEVRKAFDLVVRRLRPHLGLGADVDHEPRLPPDVYVRREDDGTLVADVADSGWFGLQTAAIPAELRDRPDALAWLHAYEHAAHVLLRQLDARAHMLRIIACSAVEHQTAFLTSGPTAHRPLTRSALATTLGVNPSTVSRAVRTKRIRLPDGDVVDFADLFGTAVAARAHLTLITRDARLSDREICGQLATRGFRVSRRAVAKYRAQLGIPAGGLTRI